MKSKFLAALFLVLLTHGLIAETSYSDIDDPVFQSPRTTALGMTGVALSDTPESIFFNPALQTEAHGIQWFGSSQTVLDDIRTYRTAVSIPLGRWGVGVGYTLTSVSGIGIIPLSLESQNNGRPLADQVKDAKLNRTSAYIGTSFVLIDKGDWIKRCTFGVTLKSFGIQTTGVDNLQADASAMNMDVGVYAQLNTHWFLGLTARNTMAGPLRWQTGAADELPKIISLGNRFSFNDGGFIVLVDTDFYNKDIQPNIIKAGLEVGLTQYIRVRTGLHQYLTVRDGSTLVMNGMTAGVGFRPFTDMSLDYAYYPGDGMAMNAVHYAGLSFESFAAFTPTAQPVVEQVMPTELKLIDPRERLLTESGIVTLHALVSGERSVTVNGRSVSVNNNHVIVAVGLQPGINELRVIGKAATQTRTIYKLASYDELRASANDYDTTRLVMTTYYQNLPFIDATLNRKDASVYVARSLELPIPEQLKDVFTVSDILYLYGVYGSSTVTSLGDENQPLTKGDMALLLARLDGYSYVLLEDSAQEKAADVLIATGYFTQDDFYPLTDSVSRRAFISALARTSKVTQRMVSIYANMPVAWVDQSYHGLTVYAPNATLVRVTANIDGVVVSADARTQYMVPIPLLEKVSGNTVVTLNTSDIYGNTRNYTFVIPVRPPQPIVVTPQATVVTSTLVSAHIPGVVPQRIVTAQAQTMVLTKAVPAACRVGDTVRFYAGTTGTTEVLKVTFVFSDEKIYALSAAPGLWKIDKKISAQTAEQYTVYVKTADGTYMVKGKCSIEQLSTAFESKISVKTTNSVVPKPIVAPVVVAPIPTVNVMEQFEDIPATKAALGIIKTNPTTSAQKKTVAVVVAPVKKIPVVVPGPRTPVLVPAYSPEIILAPQQPKAGDTLSMKVKVNMPRITKVTAEIEDVKTYLELSKQGFWYGEKVIPKHFAGKKMFIHVFVKDSAGKFSMTEKVISIK